MVQILKKTPGQYTVMTTYKGGVFLYIVNPETYTYHCLCRDLDALCCEYSFLKRFSIGGSVLGKKLHCVDWGCGEKRLFLNGAHHGMEWITSLLLMRLLEECARQYTAGTAIGTVNFKDLYKLVTLSICPMVNPDGVELSINGLTEDLSAVTRTKLKSYNENSMDFSKWQSNIHGVDLNHNYDADFEKGIFLQHRLGIYGPGPTRYSGPVPESEPESKAIADYTRAFMPHIAVAYHTQGEIIYYDFDAKTTEKGRAMAKQLSEISGYQVDQSEGMACYSGYKDWVINEFYIPAFTIEAGLGENPLPLSQFDKIYQDNLQMLLYLMKA